MATGNDLFNMLVDQNNIQDINMPPGTTVADIDAAIQYTFQQSVFEDTITASEHDGIVTRLNQWKTQLAPIGEAQTGGIRRNSRRNSRRNRRKPRRKSRRYKK